MKFGIFYEHQLPRPWEEDSEYRLIQDALEQIELADSLGIEYVWEVEHHFLEEYSHSSAPEVFLRLAGHVSGAKSPHFGSLVLRMMALPVGKPLRAANTDILLPVIFRKPSQETRSGAVGQREDSSDC